MQLKLNQTGETFLGPDGRWKPETKLAAYKEKKKKGECLGSSALKRPAHIPPQQQAC